MIPILYEQTETAFTTNGIGRLADAISCVVTEERNGIFELSMRYPINGLHYEDIAEERIIFAQPRPGAAGQAFRIYQISRPINGIVTIDARHISYQLNRTVVMPYTAGTCAAALAAINDNTAGTSPFTYWTDKAVTANFKQTVPTSVRAMLGGQTGSILDTFGTGEYEWDMYTVRLHLHRGHDNGVTIRYGKNLTDLKNDTSTENVYTAIVPYYSSEGTVVTLPERVMYGDHVHDYSSALIVPVDLTGQFSDEVPTEAQLRTAGQAYLNRSENWKLSQNINISFVNLADTEEYKNVATLQRVNLCDQIEVEFPTLGVSATAKVIKTVYNVLLERYESIEIGSARTNLSDVIAANKQNIESSQKKTTSFMQKAISYATKLIQGGLGGHVVMNVNAAGQPNEILIMDTDDIATAVNVIRMNVNGIGFSKNGYNGPFTTAWTIDGAFNADFIVSGTMQADRIKGGVLTLGGEDDVNGELMVLNADGDIVGIWDKDGIFIYAGAITGSDVIVGGTSDASLQVVNNSDQLETLIDKNGMKIYYKGTEIGKIWSTYDTDTGKRGVSYALSEKGYYLSFGYYNTESGGLNAHTRYFRDASIAGEYGWYYFSPLHLVNRAIKFVDSTESGKTMAQISNLKMSDTEEGLSFNVCTDNAKYIGFGYYADGDATFTSRTQYYAPDSELVTEEGWYANCAVHLLNALIFAEKGKYDEYNAKVSRMNLTSDGVTYKGIKVEAGCLYIDTTKLRVTSDGSSFSTGYTGTVTISGKTLTYVNGILTKVSG